MMLTKSDTNTLILITYDHMDVWLHSFLSRFDWHGQKKRKCFVSGNHHFYIRMDPMTLHQQIMHGYFKTNCMYILYIRSSFSFRLIAHFELMIGKSESERERANEKKEKLPWFSMFSSYSLLITKYIELLRDKNTSLRREYHSR